MKKRFASYREYWVSIFILGVIALGATPLIQTALKGGSITIPAVLAIGVALIAFFLFRSYSEFHDEYLLIVMGPVFERYYYRNITAIKTTRGNWLVGQAPKVRYALYCSYMLKRYISPRDWEGFLR
ncbi:MAG: hypothetical protein WCP73_09560, partial [Eubacteriales bacterium]